MQDETQFLKNSLKKTEARKFFYVNSLSFLNQIVQIGAISTLLALVLHSRSASATTIGIINSAIWLAIFSFGKFVPAFIHRYGLTVCNFIAVGLSVISLILLGYIQNHIGIFFLNFLVGCGLIMRWIACDTWIIRIAKKEVCGRAIAIHETLMGAGIACGPLVISMTGIQGSLPFLVCAGIVASSLIPLYFIKSYKAIHEDTIERKKETKSIFSFINIIPIAITSALICGFVETSSISFLSLYAVSFGYAVKSAALFLACFGAGGTLLQIPIGWMADKYGFRIAQKICALGIIITAILLIFFMQYNSIAWISAFVMGGVVGGMNTLAVLEAGKTMDDMHSSSALTLIAMFYTFGGLIGPLITGLLMDSVSKQGLMFAAIFIGIFFFLLSYVTKFFKKSSYKLSVEQEK